MNAKTEDSGGGALDTIKMFVAAAFVLGGMYAYYALPEQDFWMRVGGVIAGAVIGIVIALQTEIGRATAQFITTSRTEVRKMHWPSRQETLATTAGVLFAVALLGTFLWLLDMLLSWGASMVTGQGG